jgi:hypothetical protein
LKYQELVAKGVKFFTTKLHYYTCIRVSDLFKQLAANFQANNVILFLTTEYLVAKMGHIIDLVSQLSWVLLVGDIKLVKFNCNGLDFSALDLRSYIQLKTKTIAI